MNKHEPTFQKAVNPKQIRRVATLEPLEPGDKRYVPLDSVRDAKIRRKLERLFYSDPEEQNPAPIHIAYAGHRGNGKTTELKAFMAEMANNGYCFVYRNGHSALASSDLHYTDIMLYLAQMALEDVIEQDVEVSDKLLEPIEQWFAQQARIDKEDL